MIMRTLSDYLFSSYSLKTDFMAVLTKCVLALCPQNRGSFIYKSLNNTIGLKALDIFRAGYP